MNGSAASEYLSATELNEIIIANIYRQLSLHDWTLRDLSNRANLPYESVKKILCGKIKRPSLYSIWLIAEAFDCSVNLLTQKPC